MSKSNRNATQRKPDPVAAAIDKCIVCDRKQRDFDAYSAAALHALLQLKLAHGSNTEVRRLINLLTR